jgi:pimeloyl-ACP methyl ester carboxylesterase
MPPLPFEVRTFEDGDLTLSYEVYGSGPRTFVYMHGLLLDSHVNRRLAQDLAEAGNRVVLLDLPGHGSSDKPLRASAHRMDAYARRVIHLLDELDVSEAVVGGVSLGADVTLQVALQAPERVKAMVLEMPVLERATPVAAMIFVPLLALAHYAAPAMRSLCRLARRVPRHRLGPIDPLLAPLLLDPDEMAAVLHGVLVGPVAPTAEERQAMTMPTVVIGHRSDRLHPFGDASRLVSLLPSARLLEARTLVELRSKPERLTGEIAAFLDEVWGVGEAAQGTAAAAG